jgi:hypothetical protein
MLQSSEYSRRGDMIRQSHVLPRAERPNFRRQLESGDVVPTCSRGFAQGFFILGKGIVICSLSLFLSAACKSEREDPWVCLTKYIVKKELPTQLIWPQLK